MIGFIISPAKTMNVLEGPPYVESMPRFLSQTEQLMKAIQALSFDEAQTLWNTSDKLTKCNVDRFSHMDLERNTTAAVLAYEGIQYQHLAASIMDEEALAYLGEHLRILSGFYGVLKPFDGVVPYRLEMQAKLAVGATHDLYGFWDYTLAQALAEEFGTLINLASVEYAKAVLPYAHNCNLDVIRCLFGGIHGGKFVQRSTEAKAARGCFMRWCAEKRVEKPCDLQEFSDRGYTFDEKRSDTNTFVFVCTN